jgi:hypothetical protein
MTEAPTAMATLCLERPAAELTGPVVCIPRRRVILVIPLNMCDRGCTVYYMAWPA